MQVNQLAAVQGDPQMHVLMQPKWRNHSLIPMERGNTTWGWVWKRQNYNRLSQESPSCSIACLSFLVSMSHIMLSFIVALCLTFPAHTVADTSNFKLELTWRKGAPDGHERDMIFINGQYPGPLLDIRQDDWVEIEVVNLMPFSTTIHAHGITQMHTPWSDGTPDISQRAIQPNATFTYRWQADEYGSYMYHAHSRGQIEDGAYGPIIIRPKEGIPKPFDQIDGAKYEELYAAEQDVQPVMLTDWRHRTSEQTWNDQLASGVESAACMDSVLVNGRGAAECLSRQDIEKFMHPGIAPLMKARGLRLTDKGCVPPEYYQITLGNDSAVNLGSIAPEVFDVCTPSHGSRAVVTAPLEKNWFALDLISTAGIDTFAFSIDEHPMWVYAVDGHYIEPMKVDALTIANGDRYSVFIRLDKERGNYGMRVASIAATQIIGTTAVLSYNGEYYHDRFKNSTEVVTSMPYIDLRGALVSQDFTMFNESLQRSFPPQFPQPPPKVDQTVIFNMGTSGKTYTWALNSTHPFPLDSGEAASPMLYDPPTLSNSSLTVTTKNNTWVDLIFITHQLFAPPHTMHKHSNKAFVLGYGDGVFNWTTVTDAAAAMPQNFNLVTPPYRDGYHVVNPGAFMLHCHIQNHMSGGMAMTILDGIDEWPEVPENCRN
ncbi:hypothetical protein HBI12_229350 [Parastagonospora nodorum]|nr:hypothetical protein HBI12_229350 [Parastagonospora nodorum]